jgi:hypothetical protein
MPIKVIPVFLLGLVRSGSIFILIIWVKSLSIMRNQLYYFGVMLPIITGRLNHSFFCISLFETQPIFFDSQSCNLLFSKLTDRVRKVHRIVRHKFVGLILNAGYSLLTFYHIGIIY